MSSVSLVSSMPTGSSEGTESLRSDLRKAALRSRKQRGKAAPAERKRAVSLEEQESGHFIPSQTEVMAVDIEPVANPAGGDDLLSAEDGEIEEGEIEDVPMEHETKFPVPHSQFSSINGMCMLVDQVPQVPQGRLVTYALVPPPTGIAPVLNLAHFGVDEMHARPGLEMSRSDYEGAKEIILDLLGWGVSPEYLVDLGLGREVVFYVFDELNLRLPANLDINGLSSFPPPEVLQAFDRAGMSAPAPNESNMSICPSSSSPVSPVTPKTVARGIKGLPNIPTVLPSSSKPSSSTTSAISPRTSTHHTLPPKPPPPQAPTSVLSGTSLSVHALPFTPAVASTTTSSSAPAQATVSDALPTTMTAPTVTTAQDLNDMQARRKEELLKRKAAMASRKAQVSLNPSTVVPAAASVLTPATAVPVIHQAVDEFLSSIDMPRPNPSLPAAPSRTQSPDAMDVDQNPSASSSAGTSPVLSPSTVASSSTGASLVRASSLNKNNVVAEPGQMDQRGSGSSPTRPLSANRRTIRRPTAVELNDDGLGAGYGDQTYRLSGFAAVGIAMPLCVIDISDDENEDAPMEPPSISRPALNMPTRLPSRSATPALTSLADTEREIEALRQTIARKEHEKRMKMLSLGVSSSDQPRSKPPTPRLAHAMPAVITAAPIASSPQAMSPVSGPSRSSSVNVSEDNDTNPVEAIVSTGGDDEDIVSFDEPQESDPATATESLARVLS